MSPSGDETCSVIMKYCWTCLLFGQYSRSSVGNGSCWGPFKLRRPSEGGREGHLEATRRPLGAHLEANWSTWRPLGAHLQLTWRPLGATWGPLGAHLEHLRPNKEPKSPQVRSKRHPRGPKLSPRGFQEVPS